MMEKEKEFSLEIADWETDDIITVEGRRTAYYPAKLSRIGDPGEPGEGGEIIIERATISRPDGTTERFTGDHTWLTEEIEKEI